MNRDPQQNDLSATAVEDAENVRPAALLPTADNNTPPTTDDVYLQRAAQLIEESEGALAAALADTLEPPSPGELRSLQKVELSVVIPVYNEEKTIRAIVQRIREVGLHKEIIIVDDCSTDGTRDILLKLERDPDVRVFLHGYNRGKGAALRTAFECVKGNVIVIQDADLEYDPHDYACLLEPIRAGQADVVYGSRFLRNPQQDPSFLHRFGNWLLTAASNRLTGQQLTDMETCYKVFRRGVLDQFELKENRFGFEPEFTAKLAKAGLRIAEVPIRYRYRSYRDGKKIGLRDAVNALQCIIRYR